MTPPAPIRPRDVALWFAVMTVLVAFIYIAYRYLPGRTANVRDHEDHRTIPRSDYPPRPQPLPPPPPPR